MRLSQEAIRRMISGRSGGGGGGGSFDPSALAGYATQAWTEENYISKTFFNELFVIHKKVTTVVMDGETEISRTVTTNSIFAPNEIPGTTTETDEDTGYVTTVTTEISSIESKKGFWTNYFLSALGLNGEGGGGGLTLNEPLATINVSGLAAHPSTSGHTIVWNGSAWVYGTAGGGTGTVTGVKVGDITYSPVNGIVSLPAYPSTMAWSAITGKPTTIAGYGITDAKIENGVITLGSNTITPLTSSAITDMATKTWVGQQGFALASNVYSKTDADAKFMTIAAFENLFNALNSSDQKVSHPYSSGVASIKAMVGLWTEQYLSALGKSDSGGEIVLNEPLASINDAGLASHPSSSGQTIVWNGTAWVYGAAGMNMSELATYLSSKILTVKNGTATLGTWNPTTAGTIDIASALTDVVKYKDVGTGSVDAMSGSFFFGGVNALQSGYDYVGFQAGNSADKWQMTAIGSLRWRQNDNGGTDSSNWSDWHTILDTSNWTSTINLASLGAASTSELNNYLPLSAGSNKPLTGSLYLSSLSKGIFAPYTVGGSTVNIPLIYDNGENLWIGATQTTGTHHVGATYISAGTGEVYISRLVSDTRTNYKVLDKGNTYVSSGKGYIDGSEITTISGNAGTAIRLQGNGTYTAWGQTYWQNGVPQTVNGDMTNVGNISFSASGKNIGGLMSFVTAGNGTVGVGTLSPNTNYKLDVNGYTKTSRLYLSDTIYMVVQNDGIHIVGGGLYADTYVSALGLSDSGGGGASLLSELSDVQLSSLSNGQALIYDSSIGKWRNGAAGIDMTALTTYLASKVLTIKNGSATLGTWNPTAAGVIDIASAVSKYLPLTGGSLTGNLNIAYSHDLSKSNNGVSDTLWPGYRIFDKDGRRSAQFVNGVYSSGSNFVWMGVSNYDTSGNMIADYGIGLSVDKNGAGSWSVSEPAAFRTAIGIPALLGGYLPLSGGTMTGILKVATGKGIEDATGNGLLVYHPTNWSGISASQWGAGAVDCQGVIRSNASDLKHYRGSALYNILDSYNSGISGSTITINGTSINSVAYIEVGTNDLTGYSGSFFFGGGGALQSGYDYVGFQAGGGTDKWQVVAINNLKWRQNDNGGTDTTGWSDWRTILDSTNSGVINGKVTLNSTSLNVPISYNLPTPGTFTSGYWHRLGNYVTAGDGNNLIITIYDGIGYNGSAEQNSIARIVIKDGWQSTRAAANSVGVSIERSACFFDLQVSVVATEHNAGALWVYLPWQYAQGTYTVEGIYTSWEHHNGTDGDTTTAPVTNQTHNNPSQHSYLYFDYAYLTSNVASATKLHTTRYIWGNAFDGTSDINSNLIMPNNRGIVIKDTNGVEQNVLTYNSGNDVVIGWGPRATSDTYITGNTISIARNGGANGFYLNTSNNIGLGGVGDSSHKLYVQGSTLLKHSGGEPLTLDTTTTYNCIVYQINAASKWSVGTDANGTFYWYTQPGGNKTVMSLTSAGILNVGNSVKCTDLWIGNIHITYDSTNGGIHVANGGLSANTYVSALGVGQEGGGSQGLDIEAMWTELATPNSSRQIDSSHISSALSNYVTTNTLSGYATQQWVNQQGFVKTSGVTSVAMSVPSSLRVNTGSGATITSSGTFAITLASGYSIPTTAKQSNWDTAYGWGNHATAGYSTPQGVATQMQSYAYISGNVIHIGDNSITLLTSHQSVDGTFWGRSWSNHGTVSGSIEAGNSGGYIGGFDHIDLNTHASLYGYGGYIDFYYNGSNSYTSRLIEEDSGLLALRSPNTLGLLVGGYNGDYVQIGQIRIVYESSNNALRIENANNGGAANLYAMGGISALGMSGNADGTISGNLIPSTNATYSIGSSSYGWKELRLSQYGVSGRITIDGDGINIVSNEGGYLSGALYMVTGRMIVGASDDDYDGFTFATEGTSYLSSKVSIGGTNSNSDKLYVNGTVRASSYNNSSDARLKNIISNEDINIETIARAPIVRFTWKNTDDSRVHWGTLAQYWRSTEIGDIVEDGEYLAMDYAATALAGVISVARKVMTHEEEIAALKRRIGELENEIETLKAA